MEGTWTERADKIQELAKSLPIAAEGSPQKEFYRAVWNLCEDLKSAERRTDGGQLIGAGF
jgi:hypothetical protein